MNSNIEKIRNCKKVIVSGGVAVGKSSIIASLTRYLDENKVKWIYVPEYIDVKKDGLEMLNKYLRREITVYTFQEYVIEYYNEYLGSLQLDGDEILIFERGIDDAITCFSNLDYAAGKLTIEEFCKLYELVKTYDVKYNVPSYFMTSNRIFLPVRTEDSTRDGNIIGSVICNRSNDNIIIGLYNSDDVCYQRMLHRDRPGEKEAYSLETISRFNYTYSKLYRGLMSEGKMDFISLGKLLK